MTWQICIETQNLTRKELVPSISSLQPLAGKGVRNVPAHVALTL